MDDTLLRLFADLPLQGPGSDRDTVAVLDLVRPSLPAEPRIADFGCGTGRSTLALARQLPGARVRAVDAVTPFVERLRAEAERQGLAGVRAETGDMLASGIEPGTLDLVWSEGAAYAVGFETALRAWRPLLRAQGRCVLSECEWLEDTPAAATRAFWDENYPAMGDRRENRRRAEAAGFEVLATHTLSHEGWTAYHGALGQALDAPGGAAVSPQFRAAIGREIEVWREAEGSFGYVFYVLMPR